MNDHRKPIHRRILPLLLALLTCCLSFSYLSYLFDAPTLPTDSSTPPTPIYTVVLDAGHGGEDGGAVSNLGVLEKDLNLAVTLLLRDLLRANGVNVILTRESDTLLYDKNADYEGRKKALDFAARLQIAESASNPLFVSIHMNTYPLPSCSGLQVIYSPNHPDSQTLALTLQTTTQSLLQPNNNRAIKPSTSSIYLLHHISTPAVLVECGFLSSPSEASLLSTPDYQKKLALTLFCGIMEYINM